MTANLTVTDLFCGAGGSSSGAEQVPGVRIRMAANHWALAVETHNRNLPHADHDTANISQADPRRYPTTDLLWASPECTNHSQANGRKRVDATPDMFGETLPDEAADRSRATMWDVPRFAEHHRYKAVVVENVVDAAKWVMWPAWLHAMQCLGYDHHVVYLNSMHAQALGLPAPQSRDRMYVVFWRTGDRRPDLEKWTRPRAYCWTCETWVTAVQAWKNPDRRWGRYRSQYVWRCPNVACRNAVVEPAWLPAAAAIDWTLRGERIGDRARPLAAKTRARIEAGLARYARPFTAEAAGNTYERPGYARAWPVDDVLRTLHTTPSKALVVPVEGRDGKAAATVLEALRTQTARNETGLLVPAGGTWNEAATPLHEVMRTRTTRDSEAVVVPFIAELRGGSSDARPVDDPMATVTASGNHHGLVVPYNRTGQAATTDDVYRTFTTRDRFALVMRNNNGGPEMTTPVGEVLRTLTTKGHQSLIHGDIPQVDDCLFRMLEPHEIAAGMAFAPAYVLLGNKRERVRLAGNAVTPPAARDLIAAVVEALTGEQVAA
ncbi:MAG: DNA cytosine methyltransferase [Streptosporangiales bacterium]|nr:DNA cytosine methyltransferase [Streptosporangiales bacterium]